MNCKKPSSLKFTFLRQDHCHRQTLIILPCHRPYCFMLQLLASLLVEPEVNCSVHSAKAHTPLLCVMLSRTQSNVHMWFVKRSSASIAWVIIRSPTVITSTEVTIVGVSITQAYAVMSHNPLANMLSHSLDTSHNLRTLDNTTLVQSQVIPFHQLTIHSRRSVIFTNKSHKP